MMSFLFDSAHRVRMASVSKEGKALALLPWKQRCCLTVSCQDWFVLRVRM